MIPQDFDEWRDCIEHRCKVPLTAEFIAQRIAIFSDRDREETRRFAALYGDSHLARVLGWFRDAQRALTH